MTANNTAEFSNVEAALLAGNARRASEAVMNCMHTRRVGVISFEPAPPTEHDIYDDDRINSVPRFDSDFGF